MDEEKLIKEIADDPTKFEVVYEAFYKQIYTYVYRRTTDYDLSKDIAAETFLKAFTGISKLRWRNISILHWLYKIATNEIRRSYNSKKYNPEALNRINEEYGLHITDYTNAETDRIQLEEELNKHREFTRIIRFIKKLDIKYQDVITLRFFEQKSIKEIATILEKKEGTIKSLLSRGLDKLKDNFNKIENYEKR